MPKHSYEISINGGTASSAPYIYHYGATKNIELSMEPQKALIHFTMGSKKNVEDLISFKTKLFRDAFRKIYTIHAMKYNFGLKVETIRITIDGQVTTFDQKTPNFPFLFSMIKDKPQFLDPSWENVIAPVLSIPKSKKDTDLRFCAVYSFLAAKNRSYRIDHFINLWTAMNSYGNYIAKWYEEKLAEQCGLDSREKLVQNVQLYGKDTRLVKIQKLMLKHPLEVRDKNEINELWKNYYGVEDALSAICVDDYPELYEEALKQLYDENYNMPEKFKAIEECAVRFKRPLFIFLLLEYPYRLRCNYVHGSLSTILFSAYNDYEMATLGAVNYFIETFLNQKLPEMFSPDFLNESRFQLIQDCMRLEIGTDKKGKSLYDKAIDNLKAGK